MPAEIKLHNTLTGKKEIFRPQHEGRVNIYLCGPTVYGYTHVGNARAALTGDLVVRTLRYAGYQVRFARNITDVDDKIIKVANETGQSSNEVAETYTKAYLDEQKELGSVEPDLMPKATQHISEIIDLSNELIGKDLAYVAETPFGRDVYYRVKRFKEYGKLSKRKIDDMMVGARIEPGEMKEDPLDFALWKSAKPGEPSWESPWGAGRPGWHIECSAMIRQSFPEGLDIHMGGLDLVFPHHENEIAQSEGATDKTLAPYWLHNGMLTLAREKMSKSLGNIFSTRKFLEMYGPETLRLLMFQNHYKSPLDFTDEVILRTESLLERLYNAKLQAQEVASQPNGEAAAPELATLKADFDAALFDDFGSAKALGLVAKGVRACFKDPRPANWKAWGVLVEPVSQCLGLLTRNPAEALAELHHRRLVRMGVTEEFCKSIEDKLKAREASRVRKDFTESDRLRKELEDQGIIVMDGPDGTAWTVAVKS